MDNKTAGLVGLLMGIAVGANWKHIQKFLDPCLKGFAEQMEGFAAATETKRVKEKRKRIKKVKKIAKAKIASIPKPKEKVQILEKKIKSKKGRKRVRIKKKPKKESKVAKMLSSPVKRGKESFEVAFEGMPTLPKVKLIEKVEEKPKKRPVRKGRAVGEKIVSGKIAEEIITELREQLSEEMEKKKRKKPVEVIKFTGPFTDVSIPKEAKLDLDKERFKRLEEKLKKLRRM